MMQNNSIRLFANENIYGCSPNVLSVLKKNISKVNCYPNYNPVMLEAKIAEKFNVDPLNIVIGGGSVRIIDGIIQTFVKDQDEILTFENSFIAYSQLAATYNRKYLLIKQTNFRCDVQNILPAISKNTRVIFIANPNNPTGTIILHIELEHLLKNIPSNVLVVIDEAYLEYANEKGFPDSISLLKKFQNLIIVRTFSKAHGLAGLRIGYAIAHEIVINELKNSRIPFSINYLAEEAAIVSLSDENFIQQTIKANTEQRLYLYTELTKLGFHTIPSHSNFIYLWFETITEKQCLYDLLSKSRILICDMKIFGNNDNSLRITVGDNKICNQIIQLCKIYTQSLFKLKI